MLIASLIILQVLIFSGLIFVFRKIMAQNVVSATKHLEELAQDSSEKEKRLNVQLEEARKNSEELINKAQGEAANLRNEIVQSAQTEKENIIKTAHEESKQMIEQAEKSRQHLLSELDDRIAKEAANKACDLLQEALPDDFKRGVHERWVSDLIEKGFSKIENLRLPENLSEVNIRTAIGLSEEQKKKLSKKIKDSLGQNVTLQEEVDPKLCAGIVISIGSLVLDGSLRNQIRERARK